MICLRFNARSGKLARPSNRNQAPAVLVAPVDTSGSATVQVLDLIGVLAARPELRIRWEGVFQTKDFALLGWRGMSR